MKKFAWMTLGIVALSGCVAPVDDEALEGEPVEVEEEVGEAAEALCSDPWIANGTVFIGNNGQALVGVQSPDANYGTAACSNRWVVDVHEEAQDVPMRATGMWWDYEVSSAACEGSFVKITAYGLRNGAWEQIGEATRYGQLNPWGCYHPEASVSLTAEQQAQYTAVRVAAEARSPGLTVCFPPSRWFPSGYCSTTMDKRRVWAGVEDLRFPS